MNTTLKNWLDKLSGWIESPFGKIRYEISQKEAETLVAQCRVMAEALERIKNGGCVIEKNHGSLASNALATATSLISHENKH